MKLLAFKEDTERELFEGLQILRGDVQRDLAEVQQSVNNRINSIMATHLQKDQFIGETDDCKAPTLIEFVDREFKKLSGEVQVALSQASQSLTMGKQLKTQVMAELKVEIPNRFDKVNRDLGKTMRDLEEQRQKLFKDSNDLNSRVDQLKIKLAGETDKIKARILEMTGQMDDHITYHDKTLRDFDSFKEIIRKELQTQIDLLANKTALKMISLDELQTKVDRLEMGSRSKF
jgi:hypothetical protein